MKCSQILIIVCCFHILLACRNDNCVIVYETLDDQPISINDDAYFGANIVENIYRNGQGYIVFDAPVTEVGKHAFEENDKLTFVKLPQTVIKIDTFAFFECTSLKKCDIPPYCQYIGVGAFAGCKQYWNEELVLPNSLLYLGERALCFCSIKKIIMPSNLNIIRGETFMGTSLEEIVLPESLDSIGKYAFWGCHLRKAENLENVNYIGKYAFDACDLDMVQIPSKIDIISDFCFSNNNVLREIAIPSSVRKIGIHAFENCKRLKKIVIPEGVVSIGAHAFKGCDSLMEVVLPTTLDTLGYGVFEKCPMLKALKIPRSVSYIDTTECLADYFPY